MHESTAFAKALPWAGVPFTGSAPSPRRPSRSKPALVAPTAPPVLYAASKALYSGYTGSCTKYAEAVVKIAGNEHAAGAALKRACVGSSPLGWSCEQLARIAAPERVNPAMRRVLNMVLRSVDPASGHGGWTRAGKRRVWQEAGSGARPASRPSRTHDRPRSASPRPVVEPSNRQAIKPSNRQTVKPSNRQTVKPSNRQTVTAR